MYVQSARLNVNADVQRQGRHPAWISVSTAARSACVFPQELMGTRRFVLVTTTRRLRKEDPNALKRGRVHFSIFKSWWYLFL